MHPLKDILIDLCGLTLGNGLPILAHRPAAVQVSYLGNSETTGADHIDYMVIDTKAVPPDVSAFTFTEKLAFLPSSFMVTDVAQLSRFDSPHRDPYFTKTQVGLNDIPPGAFVFATFCNYKKIEPLIMSTWLNILRRVPHSVLWLLKFKGHTVAINNLHRELQAAGIDPSRVIMTKYAPWMHHFGHKSVADLVLDTYIKNGHTTTSDALWAGVPVLTLSGLTLSQRWAGSLLHAMNASESVVYSFKEYEDVAVTLATHNTLRQFFRRKVRANRWTRPPFQTLMWASNFERFLKSTWNLRSSYKRLYPLHVVVVPVEEREKDHYTLTPPKRGDDDGDFIYQWLKYDVELIQVGWDVVMYFVSHHFLT
jgi:protein O-GlcNAc transferase